MDHVPTLFKGSQEAFVDTVVDELIEYHNTAETNKAHLLTDSDERVKARVAEIKAPIETIRNTVDGIYKGIVSLEANLPGVIEDFKPYLLSALLKSESYNNVRLYNIAAQAIFDDMEVLFDDIIHQLSANQRGYAVEAAVYPIKMS